MKILAKSQLEDMKLAEITDQYNTIAVRLGIKTVKKFRDKPTAISRTLQNQETWVEAHPPRKSSKQNSKKDDNLLYGLKKTAKLKTVEEAGTEGTIENTIHEGIFSGEDTVEKLANYIVNNHRRPRSGKQPDLQYAVHNIKWFINKGHLKLS